MNNSAAEYKIVSNMDKHYPQRPTKVRCVGMARIGLTGCDHSPQKDGQQVFIMKPHWTLQVPNGLFIDGQYACDEVRGTAIAAINHGSTTNPSAVCDACKNAWKSPAVRSRLNTMTCAAQKAANRTQEEKDTASKFTPVGLRPLSEQLSIAKRELARLKAEVADLKRGKVVHLPTDPIQTKSEAHTLIDLMTAVVDHCFSLLAAADDTVIDEDTIDQWRREGELVLRTVHNMRANGPTGRRHPQTEATRRVAFAIAQFSPFCAKILHENWPDTFPSLTTLQRDQQTYRTKWCGNDSVGIRSTSINTFPELLQGPWTISASNSRGTLFYITGNGDRVGAVDLSWDSVFTVPKFDVYNVDFVGACFSKTDQNAYQHTWAKPSTEADAAALRDRLTLATQHLVFLLSGQHNGTPQTSAGVWCLTSLVNRSSEAVSISSHFCLISKLVTTQIGSINFNFSRPILKISVCVRVGILKPPSVDPRSRDKSIDGEFFSTLNPTTELYHHLYTVD